MYHLHTAYLTKKNIFSNNRGENEGNLATLQKIIHNGQMHTCHSGETLKFALRRVLDELYPEFSCNRTYDPDDRSYSWKDVFHDAVKHGDDDAFGHMKTKGKTVREVEKTARDGSKKMVKETINGEAKVRRGRFDFTRAMSIDPWTGDLSNNFKTRDKGDSTNPVPYGSECHDTRYHFGCSLTPSALAVPSRTHQLVKGLTQMTNVGGNQANWMNDYTPEVIVFSLTHRINHGMLNIFEVTDNIVSMPLLARYVEVGDLDPKEMVIGGNLPDKEAAVFAKLGVKVLPGIKKTADHVCNMLADRGIKP